jgi:hypothetical protein
VATHVQAPSGLETAVEVCSYASMAVENAREVFGVAESAVFQGARTLSGRIRWSLHWAVDDGPTYDVETEACVEAVEYVTSADHGTLTRYPSPCRPSRLNRRHPWTRNLPAHDVHMVQEPTLEWNDR